MCLIGLCPAGVLMVVPPGWVAGVAFEPSPPARDAQAEQRQDHDDGQERAPTPHGAPPRDARPADGGTEHRSGRLHGSPQYLPRIAVRQGMVAEPRSGSSQPPDRPERAATKPAAMDSAISA